MNKKVLGGLLLFSLIVFALFNLIDFGSVAADDETAEAFLPVVMRSGKPPIPIPGETPTPTPVPPTIPDPFCNDDLCCVFDEKYAYCCENYIPPNGATSPTATPDLGVCTPGDLGCTEECDDNGNECPDRGCEWHPAGFWYNCDQNVAAAVGELNLYRFISDDGPKTDYVCEPPNMFPPQAEPHTIECILAGGNDVWGVLCAPVIDGVPVSEVGCFDTTNPETGETEEFCCGVFDFEPTVLQCVGPVQ